MSRLDEILEQAYADGTSDTMWQNDRHIEIFATAKNEVKTMFKDVIGKESGSDMNDDELIHAIQKMYQWGISTGRQLESGKIKKVDDREWEMIASRIDQFEQTFTNRLKRQLKKKVEEL